jgi:hypothetical protein
MWRSVLLVCTVGLAAAYPSLQSLIPNGDAVQYNGMPWAGVGHAAPGGGELNPFGRDFRAALFTWNRTLCAADSDGDGYSNGEELGDPACTFSPSVPLATDAWTLVSHPGFPDSTPTRSTAEVAAAFARFINGSSLSVAFGGPSYLLWSLPSGARRCTVASTSVGRFTCNLRYVSSNATGQRLFHSTLNTSAWVPGLESVDVSNQQLQGTLDLAALTQLPVRRFVAVNNALTGPVALRDLPPTMEALNLSANALSGAVNLASAALPLNLTTLDLSYNAFTSVILGPSRGSANLTLMLRGFTGAVVYVCDSPHVAIVTDTIHLDTDSRPTWCDGCVAGAKYDIADGRSCVALANSPVSSGDDSFVTVVMRGEIYNYCDAGCSAVLGVLLAFLIATVAFIAVFKFLVPVDPLPTASPPRRQ